MLTIDGSQGEGGGQILRTALSLSMVTGKPVRIERIRAGRAKPGLMRQHLAAVRAAQAVCGGKVEGDAPGSQAVTFRPGVIRAGEYRFAIGSAGSTTLVFQTILPALLLADGESVVELEGGTHNDLAPSFDFLRLSLLPVLARMGIQVETVIERYGFQPAGGGLWRATIQPWRERKALRLMEAEPEPTCEAVVTSAMLPEHIAQRELAMVQHLLGWPAEVCRSQIVSSVGPGNLVSLRLLGAGNTTVVESVGRQGVSAERVASMAVTALRRVQKAGVPVEPHLADQLLVPMAVGAGGAFRTLRPSAHALTNMQVIAAVTGRRFEVKELERDSWLVGLS